MGEQTDERTYETAYAKEYAKPFVCRRQRKSASGTHINVTGEKYWEQNTDRLLSRFSKPG